MSARHGSWSDDNARGLGYAAVGAWTDAADAFSAAADVVATQSDVAAHDALALVLNNLAHACFRAGRVEDGIRHAQRACSLRAALLGDDAISVARARADLAVMLGSAGRAHEGLALTVRAIASIETTAGDEDLRLAGLLENAARLAMAAGEPSTAEPFLLRLHALLDLHELPTDHAEILLGRVASYRHGDAMRVPSPVTDASDVIGIDNVIVEDVIVEDVIVEDVIVEDVIIEEAPIDEATVEVIAIDTSRLIEPEIEFDDQPLRDAVFVTDVLLRSTPASSRAIVETPREIVPDIELMPKGAIGLEIDLVDEFVTAPTTAPVVIEATARAIAQARANATPEASTPNADDIFGNTTFDLVDAAPALAEAPVRSAPVEASSPASYTTSLTPVNAAHDTLGFTIEYGTPTEATTREYADMIVPPPTSTHIPTPDSSLPAVTSRMSPRGSPVVLPTPARGQRAIDVSKESSGGIFAGAKSSEARPSGDRDHSAPKLTLHHADDLENERRPRRPNVRAGRASAPRSSRGLMIMGAVTTAIAAAAGWLTFGRGA